MFPLQVDDDAAGWFALGALTVIIIWLLVRFIQRQIQLRSDQRLAKEQAWIEQQRVQIQAIVDAAINGPDDAEDLAGIEFDEGLSVHDWDQANEVWFADSAPDDALCAKGGVLCERAAGHSGSCTPAA